MQPQPDYWAQAERMKARLADIKRDPERALFSDFKGVSPGGDVSVWVDLLGRMKRIELRSGVHYEGGEQWLTSEIMAAYRAAVDAANFLDFNVADVARELEAAPGVKRRLEEADAERRRSDQRVRPDDDQYFQDGEFLR